MMRVVWWLSLENLIYSTVFFLPLYLIRFSIFGVPTNILEIFIAVIFVWRTLSVRSEKLEAKSFSLKFKIIFFLFILILIGFLTSALANDNLQAGLGIIKGWIIFPFIFFTVIYNHLSKDKILNVYWVFYISSFFVAAIALAYRFLGEVTYDGRLEAFFNSPNYLAMYLVPGIIMSTLLLERLSFWKNSWRNAWLGSLLVMLFALYSTYSYTAWMALIISLILTELIKYKKKRSSLIFVFILIAIALFLAQLENDKFSQLISLNERSSLASRIMIWKSAGKILQDNWFWGIGPGNFQRLYLEYQKYFSPYLEWAVPHPHNVLLSWWLYGGMTGLLGFFGLIGVFFRETFRKIKQETSRRDVSAMNVLYVSLGIMFYILIHGLTDTTIFKNDLAVIFWLCFLALKD